MRPQIAIMLLLALPPAVVAGVSDAAVSADPEILIRSVVDSRVVQVGDTIHVDIDVIANVQSRRDRFRLARAISDASAPTVAGPAVAIGDSGVQSRPGTEAAGTLIHRFGRRLSYQTTGTGRVSIGRFMVRWREIAHYSDPHSVISGSPLRTDTAIDRAVLPLRALSHPADGMVIIRRTGSSFVVAGHAILTSYHVIRDATQIMVRLPSGRRIQLDQGWVLDAELDIALLYIDPRVVERENITPLSMVGGRMTDDVLYTHGWRQGWAEQTRGIPIDLHTEGSARRWITTNSVRPGDSGGPLLTPAGKVLGVITSGTALQPRSDVLRQELCVAVDPRRVLTVLYQGVPPRPLDDLQSDPAFSADPHTVVGRSGTRLYIDRLRKIPPSENAVARLGAIIRSADKAGEADLLYDAGMAARFSNSTSLSNETFQAAVRHDPNHPDASYMLGLRHLGARNYEIASEFFERASRSPMYRYLGTYGRAKALIGLHRFMEADRLLDTIIQYDPQFAPAIYDRGRIRVAQGDSDAARLIIARLSEISEYWGRRLTRVIDNPVFAPAPLHELPRLPMPPIPLDNLREPIIENASGR